MDVNPIHAVRSSIDQITRKARQGQLLNLKSSTPTLTPIALYTLPGPFNKTNTSEFNLARIEFIQFTVIWRNKPDGHHNKAGLALVLRHPIHFRRRHYSAIRVKSIPKIPTIHHTTNPQPATFFSWTAVTTWIAATTLLSYCLRLFGSSIHAKPINNLLNTIGLTHYSGHLEWVATDFSVLFFSFVVLDLNRKIQLHSTERFVLAIAWTLSLIAITNDTFQGAMINEAARCTYIGTSLCIIWAMIKSYKQNQFDTLIKTGSECSYGALVFHSLIFSALAGIASFINIPGHSGIVTVPITGLAMSYGLSFILSKNQYIAKII